MAKSSDHEAQLLLAMYGQMWANINRHVLIVWQSATAIVGSLALFGLVGKNVVGLDMGTTLIAALAAWLLAHTYDSSEWFNRNQAIIAAIEREMLSEELRSRIHPVIGAARKPHSMILQFRIQQVIAMTIWLGILSHHFVDRVLPGVHSTWSHFEPARSVPYLTSIAAGFAVLLAREKAYK